MSADGSTLAALLILAPVAVLAFAIETVIGFGAILIAGMLAAPWIGTPAVVAALLPLDLALCVGLAVRERDRVDGGFLLKRLAPAFVLGLPLGMLVLGRVDPVLLRVIVGVVVLAAAGLELWRARTGIERARPSPLREIAELIAAGATHFTSAAGGSIAMVVAARALLRGGTYRATMFALWAVLDAIALLASIQGRRHDVVSLALSLGLVPSCLLGVWLGARALRRLEGERLRVVVFAALAIGGAMLMVRARS